MKRLGAALVLAAGLLALGLWWSAPAAPDRAPPPIRADASVLPLPAAPDPGEFGPVAEAPPVSEGSLSIAGTVYQQDGATPAEEARLWWAQAGRGAELTTADDGTFRLDGLRTGDVRLAVFPSYDIEGGPVTLTVSAGSEDLSIVLTRQNAIGLDIVDAETGASIETWTHVIGICRMGEFTLRLQEGILVSVDESPTVRPDNPLRLRVEAEGYRPSPVREVVYDPSLVFQTVRIELEPDPSNVAVLVLFPRYAYGEPPGRVTVQRHLGGQSIGRPRNVEGGMVELTVPPGAHDLEVWPGRRRPPWWVPVRFQVDLKPGQRYQAQFNFVRGGILVVQSPERDAAPRVDVFWDGRRKDVHREVEELEGVVSLRFGPMWFGTWIVRGEAYREVKVEVREGQESIVVLERKKR